MSIEADALAVLTELVHDERAMRAMPATITIACQVARDELAWWVGTMEELSGAHDPLPDDR